MRTSEQQPHITAGESHTRFLKGKSQAQKTTFCGSHLYKTGKKKRQNESARWWTLWFPGGPPGERGVGIWGSSLIRSLVRCVQVEDM